MGRERGRRDGLAHRSEASPGREDDRSRRGRERAGHRLRTRCGLPAATTRPCSGSTQPEDAVQAKLQFGNADPLRPKPVFFVAAGRKGVWVTRGRQLLEIDPATNRLRRQRVAPGEPGRPRRRRRRRLGDPRGRAARARSTRARARSQRRHSFTLRRSRPSSPRTPSGWSSPPTRRRSSSSTRPR